MKTALITGGTHGIGLACTIELAKQGFNIVVCSRSEERILQTKVILDELDSKITFSGYQFDACNIESIDGLVSNVSKVHKIDVLINNVGGGGRWGTDDIFNTDYEIWERVYNKNVAVAIKLMNLCVPNMLKKKWGRVITISSICGKESGARPWFNATKAAEIALMKNLSRRKEYVRNGVTFNTIAPGSIMIPDTGWEDYMIKSPEAYKEDMDRLPMGKLGKPEDIASVVGFLVSDKASFINGSTIVVDGGESISY